MALNLSNSMELDDFERELIEVQAQRSQGWRDARCGKFTASEIYKLLSEPRSKAAREAGEWSDTAMTYIQTKVGEELTGQIHESSAAYPLVWGEEQEEGAKTFFTTKTGLTVKPAGFVPFTPHSGGSPDGYANGGIVEFKCPYNSANHVEYLQWNSSFEIKLYKPEYWYQMQANMMFTKLAVCYFVSYDPRMIKDEYKMKMLEVRANTEDQQAIADKIEKAIKTKLEILETIKP